jgi:hypothetical protein
LYVIERVDEQLKSWVEQVLGSISVSLDRPGSQQSDRGVCLYLLELIDAPPLRNTTRPPLQLKLRYLVTAWAETPEDAHHLLGTLAFAAMEETAFDLDLEPVSPATWQAFGIPPQPSIVLQVPLRQERPEPSEQLVRVPLVLHAVPTANLAGTLLGPGDIPLVGATVELGSLRRSTRTDPKGQFRFDNVPGEPATQSLRIVVKGREFHVTVDRPKSVGDSLVVHLDPFN